MPRMVEYALPNVHRTGSPLVGTGEQLAGTMDGRGSLTAARLPTRPFKWVSRLMRDIAGSYHPPVWMVHCGNMHRYSGIARPDERCRLCLISIPSRRKSS